MIAATCLQTRASFAQGPQGPQRDMTIDAATRAAVIESAIKNLNEAYVFPEVAGKMQQAMRERLSNKKNASAPGARSLAKKRPPDLQPVSHDKPLRVGYSYEPIPERKDAEQPS